MKGYLFVTALSGMLLLASCSNDNEGDAPQNVGRISFSQAFVDNSVSRGVTDNANFDYFQVWGFVDVPNSRVFEGASVTKDTATGKWEVDETRYWFPNHKYYFTGIGPKMQAGEMSFQPLINWKSATDIPGGGTILFNPLVNNFQTDLVYAWVANPTINQPVPMTFNHLLSQIKIAFVNDVSEPMQLQITDVKITGLTSSGAINMATTSPAWSFTDSQVTTTPMVLTTPARPNGMPYTPYGDRAVTEILYVLPAANSCKVTFSVTPYTSGITQLGGPYTHTIDLSNQQLEMGKSYTYVATINATNLTPDLVPITFTVETVTDWDTDQDIDSGTTLPEN